MTYLAVIFDPFREQSRDSDFLGGWRPMAPQAYCFSCQIPENGELLTATNVKSKGGQAQDVFHVQKFKHVFFRPSANLDIPFTDWQHCLKDSMVKWRLSVGVLEAVEPDEEALKRESDGIGYRMYSLPNALKLVVATKDLVTLKQWASLEERKVVVEAIARQEEALLSHLRKLREN